MTPITQKDVSTYKKIASKNWHDQEWHNFMSTHRSEAIGYGLQMADDSSNLNEVQQKAQEYAEVVFG